MSKPTKRPRLSKSLAFALRFSLWCQRLKIEPSDGAELIALARRASAASARNCSEPGHQADADRTAEALDAKAEALGFTVDWPGLWPQVVRGGEWIDIPTE